jgi:uroporphyrinogen-III synthase
VYLPRSLQGRRIAIPAHAELDRLATMLEERGAEVARFPLMALVDSEDWAAVQEWLRRLAAEPFDETVFLTGRGVVRLMAAAEELTIKSQVLEALGRTRTITRGPKPARALYELGLSVELVSPAATVQGVIDCFRGRRLAGRRVGVQLFGDDGGDALLGFLREKEAIVYPVAPYRYEVGASAGEVEALIENIARDRFQAMTFTTAMQVERLFEVALQRGIETPLRAGLAGAQVAALGRDTVAALEAQDIAVDINPPRQYWMRHLVAALTARLGRNQDSGAVTHR